MRSSAAAPTVCISLLLECAHGALFILAHASRAVPLTSLAHANGGTALARISLGYPCGTTHKGGEPELADAP